ncbi:Major Facilitator Superfamily protein [Trichomonas vaginalis G3]|uniref:Major Facilitator Superfamily protein n=1 Tax=Trichomonas vaginalis (strain ATCC PRA-98 / G3) TaxID=412133 RepID=A2EQA2_TRIV3|nr:major facilitator superfamily transporter [Trichomonas vaginalis G3]EAY05185.1 Major Facilitator Superfamily protein [Trichomonas vaginalis G3]KAI5522955.1 sucrose transmembrane transporter protein [Trichomonas vaginalis G3]|eukprot:XP_001317408.1 major facilitator superfamily transporter [Trichomonas vaginalis G3]
MNDPLIEPTKHYSSCKIFCITMSCLAFQVGWTVVFGLVDPLMTDLNLSKVTKFIAWSIGPITGFFVQPIIGYYSDRCRSRFGRRRPYLFWGGVGTFIGLGGLFALYMLREKWSHNLITPILLIVIAVTYISINTFQSPARSIIGDILPPDQRTRGFAFSSILIGIGAVVTNLLGGIGYFVNSPSYQKKVFPITLILSTVTIVISLATTIIVANEKQFTEEIEKGSIFDLKSIFHMSKVQTRVSIALMTSWAAFTGFSIKLTTFYSKEVFPDDNNKGLCFGLVVNALVNTLAFLYGAIHEKFVNTLGTKMAYFVSHFLMFGSLLGVLFAKNKWVFMALMAPLGMGSTVFNTIPFSIVTADSTPQSLGKNIGALNIFLVLGQQIANLVIIAVGYIHKKWDWLNQRVGENQAYIGSGFVASAIACVLSFWIIVPKGEEGAISITSSEEKYEQLK